MTIEQVNKILATISIQEKGDWLSIYQRLCSRKLPSDDEIEECMSKMKCNAICLEDKRYPKQLKKIYQPPFVLFYYGDISLISDESKCVSVVGSRESTPYGENVTREIVSDIAKDYNIVSGLALGIDAVAHQACIDAHGKTIAVLPSGIDYCHPKINYPIYKEIKQNHLLLSEYPDKEVPEQEHCRSRNRIVAALSKMVLVTEAHERSGTLLTVGCALNSNIEVGAVPYPVGENSECNRMIKDGALLIENGNDVRTFMMGWQEMKNLK